MVAVAADDDGCELFFSQSDITAMRDDCYLPAALAAGHAGVATLCVALVAAAGASGRARINPGLARPRSGRTLLGTPPALLRTKPVPAASGGGSDPPSSRAHLTQLPPLRRLFAAAAPLAGPSRTHYDYRKLSSSSRDVGVFRQIKQPDRREAG